MYELTLQFMPTVHLNQWHACDKFLKGIREIFPSCQGGLSKMYRIYRKILKFPNFGKKVVCFKRNFTAHFRESPWRSARVHMYIMRTWKFPLFPENQKSIPKFCIGKKLLKNVTLQCNVKFSLLFLHCYLYCSENRLKINITLYGENFYYLTYQNKI